MIAHKPLPCPENLLELFTYCPETGILRRKKQFRKSSPTGTPLGVRNTGGHLQTRVGSNGPLRLVHRIIWKMMTGEDPSDMEIDHINNTRDDNRWDNLRLVITTENAQNKVKAVVNKSGHKGVFWHKFQKCWHAYVSAAGKRHHVGCFQDKDAAVEAVRTYREQLHKEFTNHG